jgi:hypothetical protein
MTSKRKITPGMAKHMRDYNKFKNECIERKGRFLAAVFSTEETWEFTYSIGNWQNHRLPELLVIGSRHGTYLNELSEMMIAQGHKFPNGTVLRGIDIDQGVINDVVRVKIIDADDPVVHQDYVLQEAVDAPVQQVILSDAEGRFPGEEGCAEGYESVPIFGSEWLH